MRIFVYETFDLDETDLWNLIVCKYILFLYDFLKVLNVVWDVSIPHPFVLYVFELNVTFVGESLQGYNDGSGGKLKPLFYYLLILCLWMLWDNVTFGIDFWNLFSFQWVIFLTFYLIMFVWP